MKRMIIALALLTVGISACFGASETHPYDAYFESDVFLSDDTVNSLKDRIPSGTALGLDSSVVTPTSSYYQWYGGFRIDTNKFINMAAFDVVGGIETGVYLNAESGELILKDYDAGVWVSVTVSPTKVILVLPSADPGVLNQLWKSGTNVYISTGS